MFLLRSGKTKSLYCAGPLPLEESLPHTIYRMQTVVTITNDLRCVFITVLSDVLFLPWQHAIR